MQITNIEHFKPQTISHKIEEQLWDLLLLVDSEFIPPLSSRVGTTMQYLIPNETDKNISRYFMDILDQELLIAFDNKNTVIGFLSFILNYHASILVPYSPSVYITTIAINPNYRKQGIGTKLGQKLEECIQYKNQFLTFRTWSTNLANIALAKKLNCKEFLRLDNNRGQNIDTIYFVKALNKN